MKNHNEYYFLSQIVKGYLLNIVAKTNNKSPKVFKGQ